MPSVGVTATSSVVCDGQPPPDTIALVMARKAKKRRSLKRARRRILGADIISVRMGSLWARHREELQPVYDSTGDDVERRVFQFLPDDIQLSRESSIALLLRWLQLLEDCIRELLSTESRLFWLQLTARIPPENVFGARPDTVWLYRQTLKLAILKYGTETGRKLIAAPAQSETPDLWKWALEAEDEAEIPVVSTGGRTILLPCRLTPDDVLKAFQVEKLCARYYVTTAALRVVWKGGNVVIKEGRYEGVEADPWVEPMIELYDRRQSQSRGLLRGFGSLASSELLESPDDAPLQVVFPRLNVERERVSTQLFAKKDLRRSLGSVLAEPGDFVPNYLPGIFDLTSIFRLMDLFSDEIEDLWGFRPAELCALLWALSVRTMLGWMFDPTLRWTWLQRGYTLIPSYRRLEEEFTPSFMSALRSLSGKRGSSRRFSKMCRSLTYRDFHRINLWERSGFRPFLALPDTILVDHSSLPFLPEEVLAPLRGVRGDVGRAKGRNFEREVATILAARVPGYQPWRCGETIRFARHFPQAEGQREIDVSFLFKDCLVVVSCKAQSLAPAFDRGEPDALAGRLARINESLREADEIIRALAEEPRGLDFEVPAEVTWVLGISCSPHVEYLPMQSDWYFLTPNMPRVCVPEELIEFLLTFDPRRHQGKPWIVRVQR